MVKSVLAREDAVYKAFPDLAVRDDGVMICIYRESLCHVARPFSRIVSQVSCDGGLNWARKRTIQECLDYEKDGGLNNPRILYLGGRSLMIICDWIPAHEQEYTVNSKTFMWHSADGGETWGNMQDTGICGHICPSIFMTRAGKVLIGADAHDADTKTWSHDVYASTDGGNTFQGPVTVCASQRLWLNEGTFVELDDGTLVCYMREDKERLRAYKAISRDDAESWNGPFPTHLLACAGRPRGGVLASGEVAVTYGFGTAPRLLVLHVEAQAVAADSEAGNRSEGGLPIRRFFIDHDRSIHPDGAYSGWTQFPLGALFVVQYITDDAPMAHIRSYLIDRSDWLLCPGGLLRTQPWRTMQYHQEALDDSAEKYRQAHETH